MVENEGEGGGGQIAQPRGRHIKKRALKNKALSVSFNEKDLRDYVTGFHKRKKKRRKEAQRQQEEAKRRKRIEERKKRKVERDLVLYGSVLSADGSVDEQKDDEEDEEKAFATISGTATYDTGRVKVTVTTSEVSREEEIHSTEKAQTATTQLLAKDTKHNLPIVKKSFKKVGRKKSRPKPRTKRDKKKGRKKK